MTLPSFGNVPGASNSTEPPSFSTARNDSPIARCSDGSAAVGDRSNSTRFATPQEKLETLRLTSFDRRTELEPVEALAANANLDLTRLGLFARRQAYGEHAILVLGGDLRCIHR